MEINQVVAGLCAGVRSSTTIRTWAEVNYSQECMVFKDPDPNWLPMENDCPAVVVYRLSDFSGLNAEKKGLLLGLSCCVSDSGKPESIEGVISWDGGDRAVEFRNLIRADIVSNLPGGMTLESTETNYNRSRFPVFSADMEIYITEEKLIGQNPYE